jgi:hypothetical protein
MKREWRRQASESRGIFGFSFRFIFRRNNVWQRYPLLSFVDQFVHVWVYHLMLWWFNANRVDLKAIVRRSKVRVRISHLYLPKFNS